MTALDLQQIKSLLDLQSEAIAEKVIEKLTRKKYQKSKTERRFKIQRDIMGISKLKKSDIVK